MRRNAGGVLYAVNYARCASYALDPTEKKPLYHFYPGSTLYSFGSLGCNLSCGFCQNWTISQQDAPTVRMPPAEAVRLAEESRQRGEGCVGLAYTYAEPVVWYEYVLDTAILAREKGLKNVLVTNGYINPEPLLRLLPLIDAMNVDVKAFRDRFYRRTCGGRLAPVLQTVEMAVGAGCHVEVTNLLIPGLNDDRQQIEELVAWIASLNPAIPLHFSRYFPSFRFSEPPTPLEKLKEARDIARNRLKYVYLGNVWDPASAATCCAECGELLLSRTGYQVRVEGLVRGTLCRRCGSPLDIAGEVMCA